MTHELEARLGLSPSKFSMEKSQAGLSESSCSELFPLYNRVQLYAQPNFQSSIYAAHILVARLYVVDNIRCNNPGWKRGVSPLKSRMIVNRMFEPLDALRPAHGHALGLPALRMRHNALSCRYVTVLAEG